jgi:hypothetical protein
MNETSRPPGGPPHPQQRVASRLDKRARRSPSFYDFIDLEQEVERLAREAFAGALDDLRLEEPEGPRIGGRGSSLGIGGRPSANANSPLCTSTYASAPFAGTRNLAEWDAKPEVAAALAGRLGISPVEGEVSSWLVGKAEVRVRLWRDKRGLYVLRVVGGWPGGRQSLALHETFAAHLTHELKSRRPPELGLWKWRMLVEFGFVEPTRVELPQLPIGAPEQVMQAWPKVASFLAIRALSGRIESEGFALSAPWFAKWSGLPEPTVRTAKRWLTEQGILVRVGQAPGSFGRPTHLWSIVLSQSSEARGR